MEFTQAQATGATAVAATNGQSCDAASMKLGPESRRAETTLVELEKVLAENASSTQSRELLRECEAAIKGAEIEVRTSDMDQDARSKARIWLRALKTRLQSAQKQALLGGAGATSGAGNAAGVKAFKDRQVGVTERMEGQAQTLQDSLKTLRETEDQAAGIMFSLAKQKETIQSASNKVRQVDDDLSYSNKLLNNMKAWWRIGSIQEK